MAIGAVCCFVHPRAVFAISSTSVVGIGRNGDMLGIQPSCERSAPGWRISSGWLAFSRHGPFANAA
jgi:hypothetical protein